MVGCHHRGVTVVGAGWRGVEGPALPRASREGKVGGGSARDWLSLVRQSYPAHRDMLLAVPSG